MKIATLTCAALTALMLIGATAPASACHKWKRAAWAAGEQGEVHAYRHGHHGWKHRRQL
jgi:hypothetical protein